MPLFETDEERTFFLATLFIHPSFTLSNDNVNGDERGDTKGAKYEARVLAAIRENPNITIAALAQTMGVSQSTVSRVLKKLKEEKIIQRDGADKRGKWVIL